MIEPISDGKAEPARERRTRDRQWLWALLPVFPLVLLALRLWYLSRQNISTMLLLIQHVNPIGLISWLVIKLIWIFPIGVLVGWMVGTLSRISAPHALSPRLARIAYRLPGWVVVVAVVTAAVTWQLRFLPLLGMITVTTSALILRESGRSRLERFASRVLPVAAAVFGYLWFLPAGMEAARGDDPLTAVLLLLPPLLTVVLSGPLPAVAAQPVTIAAGSGLALLVPLLIAAAFLRAPVMPLSMLEIDDQDPTTPTEVVVGYVVTVDDRMTTLLNAHGAISFIPTENVVSRALCPDPTNQPPISDIRVRGWHVEQTLLTLLVTPGPPTSSTLDVDDQELRRHCRAFNAQT